MTNDEQIDLAIPGFLRRCDPAMSAEPPVEPQEPSIEAMIETVKKLRVKRDAIDATIIKLKRVLEQKIGEL